MAEYIPLADFATKLGVSEEKVQEWREAGKLRAFRDGSSWKFKDSEVEKAQSLLAEEGGAGNLADSQEFELSPGGGTDEGSSGSMDSLLIEDTGESGEGPRAKILDESDDSELGLADELTLADEPAGDGGADVVVGSAVDKGAEKSEDPYGLYDADDELTLAGDQEDDARVTLGDEPRDPEGTGSEVGIGLDDDSLDLGTSGLNLEDESSGELTLDLEDDEDSSMDLLASDDDELNLVDDSPAPAKGPSYDDSAEAEINLMDDDDSSVGLVGDEDDDLELVIDEPAPAAKAKMAEEEDVLGEPVAAGEDDFMLEPVEGELEDDDSGSQVIALDSDSMSADSGLFGSSTLDEGEFGGLGDSEGLEADDSEIAIAAAPVASAPPETPYTAINVVSLGVTALTLLVAGMMVMDLMWNLWSYNEPYALNSTLMDSILSMLP